MTCKITTLVENTVYQKKLQGEHGLSLFLEIGNSKILFDTGQTDLFIRNAKALNIDLSEVDYLILSHGHYDHVGGLQHFLKVNAKAQVYCKSSILQTKIKNDRCNGLIVDDLSRFHFVDELTQLVDHLFIFPTLPIVDSRDTHFDNFYLNVDGKLKNDTFEDELVLVIKNKAELSILSACSHRGITNIVSAVTKEFPECELHLVMGGFHIHSAPSESYDLIADYFKTNTPHRIGVCHCTGIDKYARFVETFKERVFYNYTGCVETIN